MRCRTPMVFLLLVLLAAPVWAGPPPPGQGGTVNRGVKGAGLASRARPHKGLRLRTRLRVGGRKLGRAVHRLKRSKAGVAWFRTVRRVRRTTRVIQAHMTHNTDRLEGRLSGKTRRAFAALRTYNPLAFPGYVAVKFTRDPIFLGSYTATSWAAKRGLQAGLVKLGLGAGAVMLVPSLISVPLDAAVIVAREHHLNPDPNKTLRSTAVGLVKEYGRTTERQRRHYRRIHSLVKKHADAKRAAAARGQAVATP